LKTGSLRRRDGPDERSDIRVFTAPHIEEPVITARAQLRSASGAHSRDPEAHAGYTSAIHQP
jgi:hypothetical protein